MDAPALIGLAASLSLMAGWRPYLCLFATGLAMDSGLISAPDHAAGLHSLAHLWVLGLIGIALAAEWIADKIAWLDSLWDTAHGAIRPLIGALLAMTVIDPATFGGQIIVLMLGGGAALLSHRAKGGARAILNASPEPYSNIAVSLGEDVLAIGLLVVIFKAPIATVAVAGLILLADLSLTAAARRVLNRMFTPPRKADTAPNAPR
jgi:hypothetical protein